MDKTRHAEYKINTLSSMFSTVAIIGPRQCGKSTLVRQLYPDWRYFDLESHDDYQLITQDPLAFFELNPDKIIIDEAQQFPELFKVLRGVIDADRSKKERFILTGSSSPEIVKGLTESLAGRIATYELSPFKASEYYEKPLSSIYELMIKGVDDLRSFEKIRPPCSLLEAHQCWYKGGFPEPLIEGESNELFHKQWMEHYISDYVRRDIRQLFPKLNIHNFHRFLTLLAQFSGHQINMSVIARSLEVTVATIKDYLDIIHQTFIWRNLAPFEGNRCKKVQKAPKGFFRDQGLLHHILKIQSLNDLMIHPVAGFSFESFVTEEIIRGFNATMSTQIEFNYYRTIDKSEVDLIVDGPFGIIPIEIKLASSVSKRSLRGLETIMDDMALPYGIVINTAKRPERLTEKIIQIPVNYL